MRIYFFLLLWIMAQSAEAQQNALKFDLQGHRGARGLKPENTIPAFIRAMEYGVTTLELDLAITKDRQVVVSHEPWMAADICLQPDGSEIKKSEETRFNIYQLTYDQVIAFDCGQKGNPRFPEQEKISVHKPLLQDVINAVEDYIKSYTAYEVDYNLEIKSRADGDNLFHPIPEEFSDLVYSLVDQYLPWERVVVQSFDLRILQYWNKKYPHVRLAFLVENTKTPQKNIEELGFTPWIYSPYFKLLKKEQVTHLRSLSVSRPQQTDQLSGKPITSKVRVIPWTVNEPEDMKLMKSWGVDGLITDYPNRAVEIGLGVKSNNKPNGLNKN
jgi:glycerophosphoryl diester phosphodiesterase